MDNKNAGGRRVLKQHKWMNESGRKQPVSFTPLPSTHRAERWRSSVIAPLLSVMTIFISLEHVGCPFEATSHPWTESFPVKAKLYALFFILSSKGCTSPLILSHIFCLGARTCRSFCSERSQTGKALQTRHFPLSMVAADTDGDIKGGDIIVHLIWLLWQIVVPLKTVKVHIVIKSPFLLLSTWKNHSLFQCFKD